MNTQIPHEKLKALIKVSLKKTVESRQVSKRLSKLLPQLLSKVESGIIRSDKKQSKGSIARQALQSEEFQNYVQELIDMRHQTLLSRVQYESNLMLFQARQSQQSMKAVLRKS